MAQVHSSKTDSRKPLAPPNAAEPRFTQSMDNFKLHRKLPTVPTRCKCLTIINGPAKCIPVCWEWLCSGDGKRNISQAISKRTCKFLTQQFLSFNPMTFLHFLEASPLYSCTTFPFRPPSKTSCLNPLNGSKLPEYSLCTSNDDDYFPFRLPLYSISISLLFLQRFSKINQRFHANARNLSTHTQQTSNPAVQIKTRLCFWQPQQFKLQSRVASNFRRTSGSNLSADQ